MCRRTGLGSEGSRVRSSCRHHRVRRCTGLGSFGILGSRFIQVIRFCPRRKNRPALFPCKNLGRFFVDVHCWCEDPVAIENARSHSICTWLEAW